MLKIYGRPPTAEEYTNAFGLPETEPFAQLGIPIGKTPGARCLSELRGPAKRRIDPDRG
jgi:hypothetical protein